MVAIKKDGAGKVDTKRSSEKAHSKMLRMLEKYCFKDDYIRKNTKILETKYFDNDCFTRLVVKIDKRIVCAISRGFKLRECPIYLQTPGEHTFDFDYDKKTMEYRAYGSWCETQTEGER